MLAEMCTFGFLGAVCLVVGIDGTRTMSARTQNTLWRTVDPYHRASI